MIIRRPLIERLERRCLLHGSPIGIDFVVNAAAPQRSMIRNLSARFGSDVRTSLEASDLKLWHLESGASVPLPVPQWNAQTLTATWNVPPLVDGNYRATFSAMSIHDATGQLLGGGVD